MTSRRIVWRDILALHCPREGAVLALHQCLIPIMKNVSSVLCLAFALFLGSTAYSAEEVQPDFTNCRGLNYIPSGAHNPTDQWLNYDDATVNQNLDILEAFGVNAIRVFGAYTVWQDSAQRSIYLTNLQALAEAPLSGTCSLC